MIKLINMKKTFFTKKKTIEVLKNINITIKEGDFVAIMGRSGVGKSTLLNILGGLERMTEGTYLYNGLDVSKFSDSKLSAIRRKNIGFVLQNNALIDEKNALENVSLPLWYANISKSEIESRSLLVLKQLGLEDYAGYYPKELSGGQAQRVSIARALVNNPKLILADEPTGALDQETEKEILDIFKKLNMRGKTIILITHNDTVASFCNRIIRISNKGVLEKSND